MYGSAGAPGRSNCLIACAQVRARGAVIIVVACVTWATCCCEVRAQSVIQQIVDDVHNGTSGGGAEESPRPKDDAPQSRSAASSPDDSESMPFELVFAAGYGAFYIATSPYWLPIAMLEDHGEPAFFPRFPYDHRDGYLLIGMPGARCQPGHRVQEDELGSSDSIRARSIPSDSANERGPPANAHSRV